MQDKFERSLDRRAFLRTAASAALPLLADATANAQPPPAVKTPPTAGLIMRQREPENLEYPFSTLDSLITPNERFYIRSHFAVPRLDTQTWRLKVESGWKTVELTYEDLRKMPSRTITATLECAGNSRVFLTPAARGVQWEMGAVSTTIWTGVPLATVLEQVGITANSSTAVSDVVLKGADSGEIKDPPRPAGAFRYARSLPLTKALHPDTLLAYKMNGVELPPAHGYPVRALVPGWYGMASVKWLNHIFTTPTPFQGYFQTIDYATWELRGGLPVRVPIAGMLVKSAIARPTLREVVPAGKTYRVVGAAWAGENDIARVEISVDGGQGWEWEPVRLRDRSTPYAWRLWEFDWHVPARLGRAVLMTRATDSKGNIQPVQRDANRENYMINHLLPVEVEIR